MSEEGLEALALELDLDREFILLCVQNGVIRLEDLSADLEIQSARRAQLRRLHRLCRSLDLDVFAGSIIVELLERVEEMQRDLERAHGRSGA